MVKLRAAGLVAVGVLRLGRLRGAVGGVAARADGPEALSGDAATIRSRVSLILPPWWWAIAGSAWTKTEEAWTFHLERAPLGGWRISRGAGGMYSTAPQPASNDDTGGRSKYGVSRLCADGARARPRRSPRGEWVSGREVPGLRVSRIGAAPSGRAGGPKPTHRGRVARRLVSLPGPRGAGRRLRPVSGGAPRSAKGLLSEWPGQWSAEPITK
jgi:hypothetical protein